MTKPVSATTNERVFIVAILAVATAMRLFTLGYSDLWQDEYFTALFYEERALKLQNSLTYIAIYVSQTFLGENAFALRLPSLIFGVLGIYFTYLLGKELKSARVGLLAALFLAILPWHLFHSQYARYYTAVLLFTAVSHWLFLLSLRKGSFLLFVGAGLAAVLGLSSHITSVLAPFSLWVVCAICHLFYREQLSTTAAPLIRLGFWIGAVIGLAMVPPMIYVLLNWLDGFHEWTRSPAQQIFKYYEETGAILLFTAFSVLILQKSTKKLEYTYVVIATGIPITISIIGALFVSIRGDYAICYVIPAVVGAAYAVDSLRESPRFGPFLALLSVLLIAAFAAPRLLSHYTDRTSEYARMATNYLLTNRQEGDRIASFMPGVLYNLEKATIDVERAGYGSPYEGAKTWPLRKLAPTDDRRLWVVFLITRDDLAPATHQWLRENQAVLMWRKRAPRLDSQVRGVEVFLVCPKQNPDCARNDNNTS